MNEMIAEVGSWLGALAGKNNIWIAETFILVFVTLAAGSILRRFLDKLETQSQKTKALWDDALFESAKQPLKWFVWIVGFSAAAQVVSAHSDSFIFQHIDIARYIAIIVVITWFLTGFISRAEKYLVDPEYAHKPMDPTTAMAVGKLLRISITITGALVALQTLGFSISGVLAFGGIGGIAVGFAAKDLLANFFGGLMIYLDRPFAVGDWICSPDKSIEGTVEDIGWRLTCIRKFDKRPLYVPNATFTQVSVENPSRMTHRRIYETIGIRYEDADHMPAIVNDVKLMLEQHDEIDLGQTMIVNFNAFAASSLDFFVYCCTKTTNWVKYHEVKQDVLLKVLQIVEKHGAQCAFPTSTVHLSDDIRIEKVSQA